MEKIIEIYNRKCDEKNDINEHLPTFKKYTEGSDTVVEMIPEQDHRTRPWGPGNNPMTATLEFLSENGHFTSKNSYSDRSFASFNPSGYLKRIS